MAEVICNGIDVSYHQAKIDWNKVKASGVKFAILRAGLGKSTIDKQFVRNITECNRDCILIDRIGKDKVLVALPEDVVEAVYGEERSAKRRKSRKEQIETCRETIKAAEAQKDIPTEKEARIRINQWNERYNESGEGWCPSWVTEEQYVSAKAKLTRLLEEDQNDQ